MLSISAFRNAIGNFGDFENRVRFGADALQFARTVERFDPVPQIVVGQNSSRMTDDYMTAIAETFNHTGTQRSAQG